MCPRHSVCVPCPCGLKKILLKLVELPSDTFPIQVPNFTGSIMGFSIYHAIGFWSLLDNGMEISIGFDKSISMLFIDAFIIQPNRSRFIKFIKSIISKFPLTIYKIQFAKPWHFGVLVPNGFLLENIKILI